MIINRKTAEDFKSISRSTVLEDYKNTIFEIDTNIVEKGTAQFAGHQRSLLWVNGGELKLENPQKISMGPTEYANFLHDIDDHTTEKFDSILDLYGKTDMLMADSILIFEECSSNPVNSSQYLSQWLIRDNLAHAAEILKKKEKALQLLLIIEDEDKSLRVGRHDFGEE